MSSGPVFQSAEEAINLLWPITARLSRLFMWCALGLAHLLALQLLVAWLWWSGTTPASFAAATQAALQSTSAAVLGAAGVSVATILAAYLWLLRRALTVASKPLFDYLSR